MITDVLLFAPVVILVTTHCHWYQFLVSSLSFLTEFSRMQEIGVLLNKDFVHSDVYKCLCFLYYCEYSLLRFMTAKQEYTVRSCHPQLFIKGVHE